MTQGSSRKLGLALIVIGAVLLSTGARSPHSPPPPAHVYAAVIQVTKAESDGASLGDALRDETDLLESSALIEGVVSNLNLTAKWSTPQKQVSFSSAANRVSSSLQITPEEGSGQIRVRVSGSDAPQTEEIAQSVLRVYQELRRARSRQTKPKYIVNLEAQLEDIEPRLRLAIDTMERVGKDLSIADFYQPPKPEPTLLDRIRDGKEDEVNDNTDSLYSYDPTPPKNETPEQAKRRIYLKARRVADVLTVKKQRVLFALERERTRTATPQSATVQVVQMPQAVDTLVATERPPRSKGWLIGGVVSILFGLVALTRKPIS